MSKIMINPQAISDDWGGILVIDITELTEGGRFNLCTDIYNTLLSDKIYNISLKTSYGYFNDAALITRNEDYVQLQHSFVLQGILNVHAHRFYRDGLFQTIKVTYNL